MQSTLGTNIDARRVTQGAIAGAVAGLVASWVMSTFHDAWKAASAEDQTGDDPNTVKAADAIAGATTGAPVSKEHRETAGTAVHYGFGALLGAAYGIAVELFPATRTGFGTAYGLAVSLFADEMAMPALGFSPPAAQVPVPAHARGFVSHLVFGVALEASRRLLMAGVKDKNS